VEGSTRRQEGKKSSRGELMHGSKTSASTETVYKAVWYEQLLQIDVPPPALPR